MKEEHTPPLPPLPPSSPCDHNQGGTSCWRERERQRERRRRERVTQYSLRLWTQRTYKVNGRTAQLRARCLSPWILFPKNQKAKRTTASLSAGYSGHILPVFFFFTPFLSPPFFFFFSYTTLLFYSFPIFCSLYLLTPRSSSSLSILSSTPPPPSFLASLLLACLANFSTRLHPTPTSSIPPRSLLLLQQQQQRRQEEKQQQQQQQPLLEIGRNPFGQSLHGEHYCYMGRTVSHGKCSAVGL